MTKILHFGIGSIFPCSWIKQPTVLTEHVPWDDAVRRPFLPRIQKILGHFWQWNKKAKTTSHPGEYRRRVGNDCLILGDSIDPRCLNMGDSRWQRLGLCRGQSLCYSNGASHLTIHTDGDSAQQLAFSVQHAPRTKQNSKSSNTVKFPLSYQLTYKPYALAVANHRPRLQLAPSTVKVPPALHFTITHNETSKEGVNPPYWDYLVNVG